MQLKDYFLNDCPEKQDIINFVAHQLLGVESRPNIEACYGDMHRNFNALPKDQYEKSKAKDKQLARFSKLAQPCIHKDGTHRYTDTNTVILPLYLDWPQAIRDKQAKGMRGAVLALDIPTWFNLNESTKYRIMIIAQDPLRNPKWYWHDPGVSCSSPFGLQSKIWRKRGGNRMATLIELLIETGFGIYLTDSHKFFARGWSSSDKAAPLAKLAKEDSVLAHYRDILSEEIDIVKPDVILAMGTAAQDFKDLIESKGVKVCEMPHFSWNAQAHFIKKYMANASDHSFKKQAVIYLKQIISVLKRTDKEPPK